MPRVSEDKRNSDKCIVRQYITHFDTNICIRLAYNVREEVEKEHKKNTASAGLLEFSSTIYWVIMPRLHTHTHTPYIHLSTKHKLFLANERVYAIF